MQKITFDHGGCDGVGVGSLDREIFEQQSARSRGRSPIFELGNP